MSTPPSSSQFATLAAGCFWGVQHLFTKHYLNRGILHTQVGYAQGNVNNPTYQQVCSGNTHHAEVVRIAFDPQILSYQEIITFFFRIHDPTTMNRQGPDIGSQYRSGIYYESEQQRDIAHQVKHHIQTYFSKPIVTEIVPLVNFFPAEQYHQHYLQKFPSGYECPTHFIRDFPSSSHN